jgi:hypothetical protein
MRNPIRRRSPRTVIVALVGAVLAMGTVLTAVAPTAGAAGNPPWEPDGNSVGGLVFYNAAGQQITGGNLADSPVAAYVEGTGTIRAGDTKATLYGYVPVAGTAPGTWNGEALGSSTAYPNASAPAPLNTSTLPVQTGASGDESIATLMSNQPNNNAAGSGYGNLYQLRLKTTQAGQQPNVKYDSADISVDSVHGTWSVVYPAITPITTTTALTASPSSPQASGTSVTLTATVSPAAPGTVQFENGTTAVGTPQSVNPGTGVATLTTSALPVGALTLNAVYTPAPFAAYAGSTGTTSFTVTNPAPTLTGATPSHLAVGASGKVTFLGSGLPTGAMVKITGPSTGVTAAAASIVATGSTLTATVKAAAGAVLGAYTVTVTNADKSTATCTNCLTVIVAPTLGGISPSSAARGSTTTLVKVTGTGFAAGPKVTGPKGVTFSKVKFVNSTTITATMTVSSTATTGTNLGVTVTNNATAGYGKATKGVLTIT